MIYFTGERISPMVTRIRDGSDVCEYLIEGSKRAALIDTGYGIRGLREYVESLTDKPYDVFITHGHVDHASGAAEFGKVYMNLKDTELFKRHCTLKSRMEAVSEHTAINPGIDEYLPQRAEPFTDLPDQMQYDLGNAVLKFIHVPGHTPGMTVPVLAEERTAFFGDACGTGVLLMLPESSAVSVYLESLKKLRCYEHLYDRVLRQHGTCMSTPRVLEDNIENCELILSGNDDAVRHSFMGRECFWAKAVDPVTGARADGREGNIRYDREHAV